MSKKAKIVYLAVLIVNIVCFGLNFSKIDFPFLELSFDLSLIAIGIMLLTRAIKFKIDSSMFIGVALLLFGIISLCEYLGTTFWAFDKNLFWQYYLFALAVASMVTGIYFKDKLQMKLSILFLGFGLIVTLFVNDLIQLWLFITLLIVWFVVYFMFNLLIGRRKHG